MRSTLTCVRLAPNAVGSRAPTRFLPLGSTAAPTSTGPVSSVPLPSSSLTRRSKHARIATTAASVPSRRFSRPFSAFASSASDRPSPPPSEPPRSNNVSSASGPATGTPPSPRATSSSPPDIGATPPTALTPPDYLSPAELAIFVKLADALHPTSLEVQDISGGCGSMYGLDIASPAFAGLSVIKQHKMVNAILKEEIGGWHGVQLKTRAG